MTYIEKCLFFYQSNLYSLHLLRQKKRELKSIHSTSYIATAEICSPSDPVADTVSKKLSIEKKIKKLKKLVDGVIKLKADLSGEAFTMRQMSFILEHKYIRHKGNEKTRELMHVSWSTFWRRNRALLHFAEKYFSQE